MGHSENFSKEIDELEQKDVQSQDDGHQKSLSAEEKVETVEGLIALITLVEIVDLLIEEIRRVITKDEGQIQYAVGGALLGGVLVIIIFLFSLLISYLFMDDFFGMMDIYIFFALLFMMVLLGGVIGYSYGDDMKKEDVIRKQVKCWLEKNNK